MQLIRWENHNKPIFSRSVATLGNFDGMHLGHQQLLRAVRDESQQLHIPSLVITFEPTPAEFFSGEKKTRLMSWLEKYSYLRSFGIDAMGLIRFDQSLAQKSHEDFFHNVLIHSFGVQTLYVGKDFHFGHYRTGNFSYLESKQHSNFSCHSIADYFVGTKRVSSSLIRELIQKGQLHDAEILMGHPYTIIGKVIHGKKLGGTLEFPTLNLSLAHRKIPAKGVYAVTIEGIASNTKLGIANIGNRPTVEGHQSLMEVHVFDFDKEVYGQRISISLHHPLREERKFPSLQALQKQLEEDRAMARQFFLKA